MSSLKQLGVALLCALVLAAPGIERLLPVNFLPTHQLWEQPLRLDVCKATFRAGRRGRVLPWQLLRPRKQIVVRTLEEARAEAQARCDRQADVRVELLCPTWDGDVRIHDSEENLCLSP